MGVNFKDFFRSLAGSKDSPTLDISSEIAKLRRDAPVISSALEQLQSAYDALSQRMERIGQNAFPEITVLSASGQVIGRIGTFEDGGEGIYARSIRIGPSIDNPSLYTDVDGNLVIEGDVVATGSIGYDGTTYAISAGDTALMFIYWEIGDTVLTATDDPVDFEGDPTKFLIATNVEGVHDVALEKVPSSGVVRSNLSFALLEGFASEAPVLDVANINLSATRIIINDTDAEGVLLSIGAMYASADSALQYRAQFRITADGGAAIVYPVFFGDTVTLEFAFQAKTNCSNVTNAGNLNVKDSYSRHLGISYKTSLLVEWVPTITGASGQVSLQVERWFKA